MTLLQKVNFIEGKHTRLLQSGRKPCKEVFVENKPHHKQTQYMDTIYLHISGCQFPHFFVDVERIL